MPPFDRIVIGASAGGIEALTQLVSGLPKNLEAALMVVVHFPVTAASSLPQILARAGKLPAAHAQDDEPLQPGHIYVAPPNYHLSLSDSRLRLWSGPRWHGFRPAIDPLFISAAQSGGPRTLGILLSGTLDDGVDGLLEIQRLGGQTLVQDPAEAIFPELPAAAIDADAAGQVLAVAEMAALIANQAGRLPQPQEQTKMVNENPQADEELERVFKDIHKYEQGKPTKETSVLTCPECGGVLWELEEGQLLHYRCHVGHGYSQASLLEEQSRAVEAALWTAIRALEERTMLLRRLAHRAATRGSSISENRFSEEADQVDRSAQLLRASLLDGKLTGPSGGQLPANPAGDRPH